MVSSTTLQPGESATLTLPALMGMHQGMGGPHAFAVDIRSNDPAGPVKTVRWRFTIEDMEWKE